MEIQDIQRDRNPQEDRSKPLSIRTSKEASKFMSKMNISPTKVFNEAIKELMEKNDKTNK